METPKVVGSRIHMNVDEHTICEVRSDKLSRVPGGGGNKERGPNSQKRHVKGPDVFESRLNRENLLRADQGLVRVGPSTSTEGEKTANEALDH